MKVLKRRDGIYLIILCFVTYAVAYITRYPYAANITAISGEFTSFTESDCGLIGSFLFFSYAGGQLMNAFLGKWYNPRYIVSIGMILTALCNLSMALVGENLILLCIIWMINGISQSLFWCNICNIQAKNISREQMPLCIMVGGFSYCFGTCVIYAMSAALVNIDWRISFYIAALLAFAVAVWWFIATARLEKAEKDEEELPLPREVLPQTEKKPFFRGRVLVLVIFVCVIAIMNSFIRDGVTTWFPKILTDAFDFSDSIAILVTLGIAMLSLVGIALNSFLSKHVRGKLILQVVLFSLLSIVSAGSIFAFGKNVAFVFILLFGVNVCLLYCNGHIITSGIPYAIRRHGNVGSFSALLDAFCYLGSTIASFVFGLIAEQSGWGYVLTLISAMAAFAAIIAFIGSIIASKNELTKEIF